MAGKARGALPRPGVPPVQGGAHSHSNRAGTLRTANPTTSVPLVLGPAHTTATTHCTSSVCMGILAALALALALAVARALLHALCMGTLVLLRISLLKGINQMVPELQPSNRCIQQSGKEHKEHKKAEVQQQPMRGHGVMREGAHGAQED